MLPGYPPVEIHRWAEKYWKTGISEQQHYQHTIHIYDLERSVCDAVRFRNKVGMDITKEVLKTYLKRRDRNISKVLKYAKVLNIYGVLKNYLEVLV